MIRHVKVFLYLILAACFFPVGAAAQDLSDPPEPADDADASNPAAVVAKDRAQISTLQRVYLTELATVRPERAGAAKPAPLLGYVDQLRSDLRAVVLANLGASNEADRAVARAAIAQLEARIAGYESAYGNWDGVRTNRWSVLKSADLGLLETQLRERLRLLLAETIVLPESGATLEARALGHELRAQLDALAAERTQRTARTAQLMTLSETPTTPRAEAALKELRGLEGPRLEFEAERALAFEVEKGKAWAPGNRALQRMDAEIKAGKYKHKIAILLRDSVWRSGWPPGRGPPPDPGGAGAASSTPGPKPKSPSGGGAAVAELRAGLSFEIEALARRDLRAAADGAARWTTAATWLNERVGHAETGFRGAILSLSEADLKAHLTNLEQLKASLIAEEALRTVPDGGLTLEIKEVDARLKVLRSEIKIRGPPGPPPDLGPRGPTAMAGAADGTLSGGRGPGFSTYAEQALEEQRLFELERRKILANDAQRALLQEAIDIQKTRVRQVRAQALTTARAAARAAESNSFIHGRGLSGALLTDTTVTLRRGLDTSGRAWTATAADAAAGRAFAPQVAYFATSGTAGELGPQFALGERSLRARGGPDLMRFDKSFTRTGPNSVAAFKRNPRLAPGGIVVDLTLPVAVERNLLEIDYDPRTERFRLRMQESGWVELNPAVPARTARAAMGFVLDGRVAAVDIGTFNDPLTIRWLQRTGILPKRRTVGQNEALVRALTILSVVRYNPAIAHTAIAADLTFADELIFRVASLDPQLKARDSVFRGLEVTEPHRLMKADRLALSGKYGALERAKSVLWVDDLALERDGDMLIATARFDYTVYLGEDRAPLVSDWLTANHQRLLERAPELETLSAFAIAAAVLRSAKSKDLLDGADALRLVIDPGHQSPSLLCRSDVPGECDQPFFLNMTAVPSTELE